MLLVADEWKHETSLYYKSKLWIKILFIFSYVKVDSKMALLCPQVDPRKNFWIFWFNLPNFKTIEKFDFCVKVGTLLSNSVDIVGRCQVPLPVLAILTQLTPTPTLHQCPSTIADTINSLSFVKYVKQKWNKSLLVSPTLCCLPNCRWSIVNMPV